MGFAAICKIIGLGKGGKGYHRRAKKRGYGIRGKDNIKGITKPAIRRLARRGGVTRISGNMYDIIRQVTKEFLQRTLKDACIYADHAKRSTITSLDIVYGLKRQGRHLYGFGN